MATERILCHSCNQVGIIKSTHPNAPGLRPCPHCGAENVFVNVATPPHVRILPRSPSHYTKLSDLPAFSF